MVAVLLLLLLIAIDTALILGALAVTVIQLVALLVLLAAAVAVARGVLNEQVWMILADLVMPGVPARALPAS